jgi:hypothetical protein
MNYLNYLFSKDVRLPVNMQRSMAAEAEGQNCFFLLRYN